MGFHNTTGTNVAIVPELWSRRYYEVLRVSLPWIDSVDKRWEQEMSIGDTINISQIPDFDEATELSEGAAADVDTTTVQGYQLIINKMLTKDFKVTKRADLQSLPFMDSLREKAVFAIMKKMQSIILDTIVPSTSPDHTISYDSPGVLALSDIISAKTLLDEQNVPMPNRILTVGATQLNQLFNITSYNSKDFIPAGSPITSGEFQTQLSGFTPKFTTAVGTTTYAHHPSFLTMGVQSEIDISVHDLGVDGVRGTRVNTDLLFGLLQLDGKRVVTIS